MSLLAWIKKEWRAHRRWKLAYYRGYGILGTLLFSYKGMSREKFAREYRHMERLYRLTMGDRKPFGPPYRDYKAETAISDMWRGSGR